MIRLYVGVAAMSLPLIAAVCGPADASHSGHEHELGSEGSATLASPTAASSSAPSAAGVTLPGLSGRLTYETASEDVTVQLPGATEIERHAIAPSSSERVSADGEWRATFTCVDDNCTATTLTLIDASGAKRNVRVAGSIDDLQWSPVEHAAAFRAGAQLRVVVDPAVDSPRAVAFGVGGFAWRRDGVSLIVADNFNV